MQATTAEIRLPTQELRDDIPFFTTTLGMRLEMIYPADDPRIAVFSGYGLRLRVEKGATESPGTIRILTDNPDMTQDKIDFAIEAMIANGIVDSGDTLELGIGAMTAERSLSFYNDMVEAGVLPEGLDYEKAYDLTYINQGRGLELRPE